MIGSRSPWHADTFCWMVCRWTDFSFDYDNQHGRRQSNDSRRREWRHDRAAEQGAYTHAKGYALSVGLLACILQSATIPPAGLAPGSYPPVGPECSALYNEHDDTEEGEEPESVPGEPGYPDTNDQSKKERVKPLISEKAVRLRALQPQHGSHEDLRRPAPASAWEA